MLKILVCNKKCQNVQKKKKHFNTNWLLTKPRYICIDVKSSPGYKIEEPPSTENTLLSCHSSLPRTNHTRSGAWLFILVYILYAYTPIAVPI